MIFIATVTKGSNTNYRIGTHQLHQYNLEHNRYVAKSIIGSVSLKIIKDRYTHAISTD